jgi:Domain of unknown function (DUF222)
MSSIAFKQAAAAWDAVAEHADKPTELLSLLQRWEQLERVEALERILAALRHELINQLAGESVEELGGTLPRVLADRLRIRRGEAARRIEEAADLAPRLTLTGESLPPKLEATAAGQRAGSIGGEHVKIIRGFFAQLPSFVDEPTRADAEQKLATVAASYRPDQLQRFADHLDLVLNPDGNFSDEDRARRRGITVGPQGTDGMSRLSGWLNPELRAGLDAVLSKWAAPGMCNPADESPTVEGTPSREIIDRDARSAAQRNHDAFSAMVRSTLMSGELGSHQGLPVTIVATATLEDLQAKSGVARTAGGTLLPMRDVIRMAAHAYNYLLIFDKAKRCELFKGRTTRLATPEQRLVLYAYKQPHLPPLLRQPGARQHLPLGPAMAVKPPTPLTATPASATLLGPRAMAMLSLVLLLLTPPAWAWPPLRAMAVLLVPAPSTAMALPLAPVLVAAAVLLLVVAAENASADHRRVGVAMRPQRGCRPRSADQTPTLASGRLSGGCLGEAAGLGGGGGEAANTVDKYAGEGAAVVGGGGGGVVVAVVAAEASVGSGEGAGRGGGVAAGVGAEDAGVGKAVGGGGGGRVVIAVDAGDAGGGKGEGAGRGGGVAAGVGAEDAGAGDAVVAADGGGVVVVAGAVGAGEGAAVVAADGGGVVVGVGAAGAGVGNAVGAEGKGPVAGAPGGVGSGVGPDGGGGVAGAGGRAGVRAEGEGARIRARRGGRRAAKVDRVTVDRHGHVGSVRRGYRGLCRRRPWRRRERGPDPQRHGQAPDPTDHRGMSHRVFCGGRRAWAGASVAAHPGKRGLRDVLPHGLSPVPGLSVITARYPHPMRSGRKSAKLPQEKFTVSPCFSMTMKPAGQTLYRDCTVLTSDRQLVDPANNQR